MSDIFKFSLSTTSDKKESSLHIASQTSLLVPNAVQAFLAQIFDVLGSQEDASSYARSIILPLTFWSEEEFNANLIKELSQNPNLAILEREFYKQQSGKTSDATSSFILTLHNNKNEPVYIKVNTRYVSIAGDNKAHIISTLSEHKENIEYLNEYNRLLNIIDCIPGYVVLIDQNHKILFENRSFCHYFGAAQGGSCHTIMRKNAQPCTVCHPFEALRTNTLSVSDWAPKDGDCAFRVYSYPFEEAGGERLLLKVGLDITAGLRTQEALSRSEDRYRTIADNLSVGVVVMGSNQLIGTSNPRFQEWFGQAGTRGKPFYALFNEKELSDPKCPESPILLTFQNHETHEMEVNLNINGKALDFRLSCYPILTPRKQAHAVVVMLEDITERKLIELRLAKAKKIESIGNLASGIAHEINQPLSAVHLYTASLELLLEKNSEVDVDTIKQRLKLILKEAGRIKEIISQMRALALQEKKPKITLVSLNDALQEVISLTAPQLERNNIKVINELNEETPKIRANKLQLEQVLMNLLTNSIHAFGAETQKNKQDKKIIVRAKRLENKKVELQVIDNGSGLLGIEDKIFDPFFSESSNQQSMGLGLSIVHSFVQGWSGEISAKSVNDGETGAIFELILHTDASIAEL